MNVIGEPGAAGEPDVVNVVVVSYVGAKDTDTGSVVVVITAPRSGEG